MLIGRELIGVNPSTPQEAGEHPASRDIGHNLVRRNDAVVFKHGKQVQVNLVQHREVGMGNFGPVLKESLDMDRHIGVSFPLHPVKYPLGDLYGESGREPLTKVDCHLGMYPRTLA